MNIRQMYKQAIEAKEKGDYLTSSNIIDEIGEVLLKQPDFDPVHKALVIREMARINYIYGDFGLALNIFKSAGDILINANNPLVLDKLKLIQTDLEHTNQTILAHKNGQIYQNYTAFRESFDPYFKEHGDFNVELFTSLKKFLIDLGIQFDNAFTAQINHATYGFEFSIKNLFLLRFQYEKECYEMSKRTSSSQIRIENILINPPLKGKGLSKKILNFLFSYVQSKNAQLWLVGVVNRNWCDYLTQNCAKLVHEETIDEGAYLILTSPLPEKSNPPKETPQNSQEPKMYYKTWSIQKRTIIDSVMAGQTYVGMDSYSSFVTKNPDLINLYNHFTDSFNSVNNTKLPGLIYTFYVSSNETGVVVINDYQEFKQIMKAKKPAIESLWRVLSRDDVVVVELEYEITFNPIFIDINDFQALIPPVTNSPPYSNDILNEIIDNVRQGTISASVFPSHLIQGNAPFIKKENILGVYDMFDI